MKTESENNFTAMKMQAQRFTPSFFSHGLRRRTGQTKREHDELLLENMPRIGVHNKVLLRLQPLLQDYFRCLLLSAKFTAADRDVPPCCIYVA